jgi:hypothetical protein
MSDVLSPAQSDFIRLDFWREELLKRLLWATALLVGIRVIVAFVTTPDFVVIVLYLPVVVAIGAPRLGYTFRALCLIGLFFAVSVYTLKVAGPGGGTHTWAMVFFSLSGLFFGFRIGVFAIGAYLASILVVAFLVLNEWMPVMPRYQELCLEPVVWIEFFATMFVGGCVALASMMYIVHRLSDSTENLEVSVANRTRELKQALDNVKQISGLLPICAQCKKVRDDTGYWSEVESYITSNSEAQLSHGICPECAKKMYPDFST